MRFMTARAERSAKSAPAARARRARRWSRRSVLAAAAAALLVAITGGGWWLQRSGVAAVAAQAATHAFLAWTAGWGLEVGDVQVEGRERTSREAILAALGVGRGTPILAIDPGEAKRRLESIAWVRSASVERQLPDALYIHLVERQPLAFWQRQGKLELVDRDGVVVPSDRLDSFGALIVLVGPDAPKAGAALLDMLATEPELAPHVAAAVRIGGRRWNLRLDSGIDVALPEEDPAAAWHRLAQLERSDGILERDIELVDMRLADRLVVRSAPSENAKTPPKKGRQPGKNT
ncbi:MAG: cell division protein FtsQ/DivIB [Stellaceae bacterium]